MGCKKVYLCRDYKMIRAYALKLVILSCQHQFDPLYLLNNSIKRQREIAQTTIHATKSQLKCKDHCLSSSPGKPSQCPSPHSYGFCYTQIM